jgi:hypothetical protein
MNVAAFYFMRMTARVGGISRLVLQTTYVFARMPDAHPHCRNGTAGISQPPSVPSAGPSAIQSGTRGPGAPPQIRMPTLHEVSRPFSRQ